MTLRTIKIILCTLLFLSVEIYSDTFTLKDGKKIKGTQIERTKQILKYKDVNGKIKTIPMAKIKSVTLDKAVETIPTKTAKEPTDDLKQNDSSLAEKIKELYEKIEILTEKNKEQDEKIKEQAKKNEESSAKDSLAPTKDTSSSNIKDKENYTSTAGSKSVHPHPAHPSEKDDEPSIELTHEVVSDFIWRGNSYGGEYLSRRNNTAYNGTTQYWAYQPNIRLNAPIKGLYLEFWGNLALVGREDRDSDMRIFQASPGAAAIDPNAMFSKLDSIQADPSTNNLLNSGLFFDPAQNIVNAKCESDGANGCTDPSVSFVDPRSIKRHKEKNGMARTDGGFTTFAYNFQNKKFGDITWGIWFYYQFDKNAKYSWDEYFIFWGLPFLEQTLKPTISFYTQSSFDYNSIYAGGHYGSFAVSHTFFEGKFFRVQPSSNLGYKYQNDNINQKSGFYDLSTSLKFFFADFFFSLNHVYRPDVYMYDNDTWYYSVSQGTQAQPNRSQYDGKTVDPSKLFGAKNEAVYSAIDKLDAPDALKSYAKAEYQSQKIVQNLFYISFGYNQKF